MELIFIGRESLSRVRIAQPFDLPGILQVAGLHYSDKSIYKGAIIISLIHKKSKIRHLLSSGEKVC